MDTFIPDYKNLVASALNREVARIPLYEHIISDKIMEEITGRSFADLAHGTRKDKLEYLRNFCGFFKQTGYDTVSFERTICDILPGGGALVKHTEAAIKSRDDFEKYPFDEIPDLFFKEYSEYFELLPDAMPEGMKAVGGPGNGVFEIVQDLVGYMNLCYMLIEDEVLFKDLFIRAGQVMLAIWERFLKNYAGPYCICRFGDDLGFRTSTLLSPDSIREHIIPVYATVVKAVHDAGRPFLLHSCGSIWAVMDDLINIVHIDAKHSNEDQIAPFPEWVRRYGDRIGNFGGVDTDAVCRLEHEKMAEYIKDVVAQCKGHGGFAFGSGNSIPAYVPADNYMFMVETFRKIRGE